MNSSFIAIARSRRDAALNSIESSNHAKTHRPEMSITGGTAHATPKSFFRSSRANNNIFI